jgi:hypothetical protein
MAIHFPAVPATFRNVPRTGSTSFKHWARVNIQEKIELSDIERPNMLTHRSLDEIKKMWPNHGTTFAFVRNPYDRLVSIFHFLGQDSKKRIMKRKSNPEFEDFVRYPIEADIKIMLAYKRGFTHWIKSAKLSNDDSVNIPMFNRKDDQTQMYWFNFVRPDIVVKLENIDTEFVKIQDLLNCHKPFIHINSSLHTHYRDYYNTETQKIAEKWLEEDLDTFGYTF